MHHNDLRDLIIMELCKKGWLAWANNSGKGRGLHSNTVIKIGLPGSTDIIAIKPPSGQAHFIEVKILPDTLGEAQRRFKKASDRVGAKHLVITDRDDYIAICALL